MFQSLKNIFASPALALLLFFILPRVYAQHLNFENFTSEQGLSDKQVLSIGQDRQGYMLFGTYKGGITRYNGLGFEKITDKDGLPSNLEYSISTFNDENLIIGTDKGLSIYNGKRFKNYSENNGLPDESVFNVLVDSKKTVWIGTGRGVGIYSQNKFSLFDPDTALNNSIVFNIYEDSKNNIWFCTAYNGLFRYNGQSVTRYNAQNGLKCDAVYSIIEVGPDTYWILTENNLFQLKNGKVERVDIRSLSGGAYYYCSLKDKRDGSIWIGTDQGVLKYYNGKFSLYTSKNGLVNDVIWKVFQDRENNLWFASKENGVSKLSSERFLSIRKGQGLPKDEIKGVLLNGRKLIVLTPSAITELENYKVTKNLVPPAKLLLGDLTSLALDNKTIWLASEYGMKKMVEGRLDTLPTEMENKNFIKCYSVIVDSKKRIWLGTFGGLATLVNDKIVPYTRFELNTPVKTLHEDKKGRIWIGTNYGLYLLTENMLQHFTVKEGVPERIVQAITEDKTGSIYVGTDAGLFIRKDNEQSFIKVSDKNKFSSNDITSVFVDNNGYLWAGTTNGLNRIKMENDSVAAVKYYGVVDGFTGESCTDGVMLVDSSGHLLVGTNNGLMIYQPEFDFDNRQEPLTQITGVKINNTEDDWRFYMDSVKGPDKPKSLVLSYVKNNFIFSFVGVSLTAPEKVKYQYMLVGFDEKYRSTTQPQVAYNNLDPGTYEFLVKACNNDGLWNKEPVSFKFKINPPFYQTWWFYSICILIVIGGIFSYIKIKRSNVQILKQQAIIQSKNSELEKANDEIAQYNKNITDSITYAKRIQEAILPAHKRIREHLKDFFILYKPKDIVSGDFYWFDHFNHKAMIAAVDCTGHGVPGALVSMVGHNGLTRVINEFALTQPAAILDKLNELVEETLRQNDKTAVKDGMDMSIVTIDDTAKKLQFAGANNGVYLLRKKGFKLMDNFIELEPVFAGENYNLFEIKPDKQPIGSELESSKKFTNHTINVEQGDLVYLFTDGYADQFGGPRGKKFLYKPFKQLLLQVCELPMADQKKAIANSFKNWKGSLEQVDDVCIIGIRLG